MIERVENELVSLAKRLQIEEEEMSAKYAELALSNNLDLEDERQQLMAMSLTRQYVRSRLASNRSNSQQSFGAMVTGFFVGIEPVRDIMEYKRKNVRSRYNADASQALTDGLVAEIVLEDGEYKKTQVKNGEWETKVVRAVPASAIEVGEDHWIVPLDPVKSWASGDANKNYGKPLPREEWVVRAHFIGGKTGEDAELWTVQLKGDEAKNFNVQTFRPLSLYGIFNEDRKAIYGIRGKTASSVQYIDVLDEDDERWFDVTTVDYEDGIGEHMAEYVADLMELDLYHEQIQQTQGPRLIVTDGIVTSMNLTANAKTGNRVIWVEPVDANYGFSDEDIPESTPVWVPSHVDINFGVGSDVIVVGRTNQTQKKDEDGMPIDGEYNPVTINLYGVYARTATGAPEGMVELAEEEVDFF
mgnify:CR=1 FL=1